MATPAQTAANRLNATHSTGPVTEAGKQVSSRNATTHGMTSGALVIPGESIEEFNALRDDVVRRLAPEGALEHQLAEAVVIAQWRQRRILRFEAAFWQFETANYSQQCTENGTDCDPVMAAAHLFSDPAGNRKLSLLLRYLNAAGREYRKAMADLEAAQQQRIEQDEARAADEQAVMPDLIDTFLARSLAISRAVPESGFVSQTAQNRSGHGPTPHETPEREPAKAA